MVDQNMVGTKVHFTWQVERGKIAEFIAATGDSTPIYSDKEAAAAEGYQDPVWPPTFTPVPLKWSGVLYNLFSTLGMPVHKLMHAEQSYQFHREILTGDTLSGVMEVKSITSREGKSGPLEFILFETVFVNQHEEEVLQEEMLVVVRS
ncbi:MAG: MaoC family dehydratase N-terminal domain-containing protein [Deltaproteobacteria bacterium]